MDIKYYLDGVEITPQELAGKSGHLKMVVSYTNSAKTVKTINGKKQIFIHLSLWYQECSFRQTNLQM